METVYPRRKDVPKGFLDAVVGDTRRQVESKRVEEVVSSGSIEHDLRLALQVRTLVFVERSVFILSAGP